jgi:dTDP-4-dehydrorhamnose reductase
MRKLVSLLKGPILITGGTGQLGHALADAAQRRGLAHVVVRRPAFDFDASETINACLSAAKPGLVINAAAYTAVDAAESNAEAADRANHTGPAMLAGLCAGAGIPLIHLSTDYVFDGEKGSPYLESDPPHPAGIYGASKRAGELAVLGSGAQAIILRTAWVYAAHGRNFARTMLNAARKTNALRVVADQKGTPTAAPDLASAILDIAALLELGWKQHYRGIFHATGTGETTWYGFATAIFAAAAEAGVIPPTLTAICTGDWPTPAKRPADSRLDCSKLASTFGVKLPAWQVSVPPIVRQLLALDGAR